MMRPHPAVWLQRTARDWWPFFAAMAAVALICTMSYVTYTVVDERRYFEAEAERDRRQDEQMQALIEAQDQAAVDREQETAETVADALASAEVLLTDLFARHDENVALKLNDLLHRIEALLGRPAGEPLDPVTAHPFASPTPAPAPSAAVPPPAPRSTPATTTTTTPDQRSCTKRPAGPRC